MSTSSTAAHKQRDYYEVLGLTKEATKEEIRKAYRKQALIWHPDRNIDNVEEATHRFKEIQDAYEILFDDQERAWYDENKHIILSRGMAAARYGGDDEMKEPEQQNLWSFLSSSSYTTFKSKDKNNFFEIYQRVFDTILKEDEEYKSAKAPSASNLKSPSFGDENTPYEQVAKFYTFWSTYNSKRSFAWKDKWRLSEAENRFVKRQMEKENETERNKARKEYNDLVKHLLKKVKADDPRVKEEMKRRKKIQDELDKKKEESKLLQEQLKKEYLQEKERLRQQLLSGEISDDDVLNEEFSDEEEFNQIHDALDEAEDVFDNFYATSSSKKAGKKKKGATIHDEDEQEPVVTETTQENENLPEVEEKKTEYSAEDTSQQQPEDEEEENAKKKKKEKKKKKLQKGVVYLDREQIEMLRESMEQAKTSSKSKKSKSKKKNIDDEEEEQEKPIKQKGTKKQPIIENVQPTNNASEENEIEEEAAFADNDTTPTGEASSSTTTDITENKKKKRRNKDKKKEKEPSLSCNVCGESFPTRNALFTHIKKEGHALHK